MGAPFILFFVVPILSGDVFFHEDIVYYFYSLRSRLHLGLSQWNPWTSMGLPLLGDGQLGAFFPLNLPYYIWPTSLALTVSTALSFLGAGALMYIWLLRLGLRPLPAALGTTIFVWTGFFWQHLHHLTFIGSAMWLPAFFLGVDEILKGRRGGMLFLAMPIALSALAGGSPQLLIYGIYAALFYGLMGISKGQGGIASRVRAFLPLVGAVFWGLLSAAVVLGPFFWAAEARFEDTMGAYERSASFSVHPLALIRLLIPNLLGNPFYEGGYQGFSAYWEEGVSVGIITLFLVPLGARGGAKSWRRRFFSLLMLVSFLGMLGSLGLIHPIFYALLPGYGLFRAPGRLYLLFTLAAGVLAAFGLERLMGDLSEAQTERWQKDRKVVVVLGLEFLALALLYLAMGDGADVAIWGLALAFALILGTEILLRKGLKSEKMRRRLPLVLSALLLLEVLAITSTFNHPQAMATAETPSSMETYLGDLPDKNARILVDDGVPPRYLNAGMDMGYYGVRGYNPLNSKGIHRLVAGENGGGGIILQAADYSAPHFELMGAKYRLSPASAALPAHFKALYRDEGAGLVVYENQRALDRLYFPGDIWIEGLDSPSFDAKIAEAAALRPPALILPFSPTEAMGPIDVVGAEGQVVDLKIEADLIEARLQVRRPGFVVMADTYARGWTATANGLPLSIFPAYGGLRAIYLPEAGDIQLRMHYQQPGLLPGAILSILGLLAMLLVALFRLRPVAHQPYAHGDIFV